MTNFQEIGMAELSRIEGGTCIPIPPYNPDPNPFPTAPPPPFPTPPPHPVYM